MAVDGKTNMFEDNLLNKSILITSIPYGFFIVSFRWLLVHHIVLYVYIFLENLFVI